LLGLFTVNEGSSARLLSFQTGVLLQVHNFAGFTSDCICRLRFTRFAIRVFLCLLKLSRRHARRPKTLRPDAAIRQIARPQLSVLAPLGAQATLRRAGALRAARALRAGLRRALPARLAVVLFAAGLAAFLLAILAMSLLSLSSCFSAQYESTILEGEKIWASP
jgi:hypothetical protein